MQNHTTNQNIKRNMWNIKEYGSGYGQYCILDDYTHHYVMQNHNYNKNLYTIQEGKMSDLESGEDFIEKYNMKDVDYLLTRTVNYTVVSSIAILGAIYYFKYW